MISSFSIKMSLYSVAKIYYQKLRRTTKSNLNYIKSIGKNCKNSEIAIETILVL